MDEAAHSEQPRKPVERIINLRRTPQPGPPPIRGAQWDEVHARWERWDEATAVWLVVDADGTDAGTAVDDLLPPPTLARELQHADELDLREKRRRIDDVVDVRRTPAPAEKVPGAQWNEIAARWERWDAASNGWVEVVQV